MTPYHQRVDDNIIAEIVERLEASSRLSRATPGDPAKQTRQAAVVKRGIALTPVKFGISFTATWFNQAGALVHV